MFRSRIRSHPRALLSLPLSRFLLRRTFSSPLSYFGDLHHSLPAYLDGIHGGNVIRSCPTRYLLRGRAPHTLNQPRSRCVTHPGAIASALADCEKRQRRSCSSNYARSLPGAATRSSIRPTLAVTATTTSRPNLRRTNTLAPFSSISFSSRSLFFRPPLLGSLRDHSSA